MNRKPKKYYNKKEALIVLQKYCAYQDRCHQDVRTKLLSLQIYGDDLEEIIVELIEERFLDEERYARSFVRGKYRIKKWGIQKIVQQLKQKKLSQYCIKKGLEEIDMDDYKENLSYWIDRKRKDYKKDEGYILKQKIIKFCYGKGYDLKLIQELLSE